MIKLSRVEGNEFVVEAKPVRRGFLRKGGGRHDPEDFEVVTVMLLVLMMVLVLVIVSVSLSVLVLVMALVMVLMLAMVI